jgi:hypothetical protein
VQRRQAPAHALHLRRARQHGTGIADEVPTDEVAIAAVVRVAEGAFERESMQTVEDGLRVGEAFEIIADGRVALPFRRDEFSLEREVFFKTPTPGFSFGLGAAGGFP